MNCDLGQEQQWQRYQKPYVGFDVVEKGEFWSAQQVTFQRGQNRQRHPTQEAEKHDPATQQLEGRTRETCPAEHLIEWSAQYQREIRRFLLECWCGHHEGL